MTQSVPATDYDLHGLASVRLAGATPDDAAMVTRQLGALRAPLSRDPDILVRFVDRLPITSPIRSMGADDAGFTDDAFLMEDGRAQIRLETIGKQCEIVCETGIPEVPLLLPILRLSALSNGAVPVHASAFTYNGTGVLATGWPQGSKTGTLLAFMSRGARYIGDDWVYVSGDGRRLYGVSEPIAAKDHYLRDLPLYQARIGRGKRARLRAIGLVRMLAEAGRRRMRRGSLPEKVNGRLIRALSNRQSVTVRPEKLFGEEACAYAGTLDKVLLLVSHDAPGVTVQALNPRDLARRMAPLLQSEREEFLSCYRKFRFAFPDRESALVERVEELQREMLERALSGKDAYMICHPHPVSIPALFEAICPLISN